MDAREAFTVPGGIARSDCPRCRCYHPRSDLDDLHDAMNHRSPSHDSTALRGALCRAGGFGRAAKGANAGLAGASAMLRKQPVAPH